MNQYQLLAPLIICLCLFSATPVTNKYYVSGLWVWNVGQGQFVSWSDSRHCRHFDMGGEFFPTPVIALCRGKLNSVSFSHWDWDHIGMARRVRRWLPNLCIHQWPPGDHARRKWLEAIPSCPSAEPPPCLQAWEPTQTLGNHGSRVWLLQKQILLPGDSTDKEEKVWVKRLPHISETRILILGHHGSRTSTSENLVHHLRHLHLAIASSRWARYHHPHPIVVDRLKKNHVALLQTERWGHVAMEISGSCEDSR